MTISSKRAEHVSLFSLTLSVILFIVTLLLGHWSGFRAVSAVSWAVLASGLIWLVLWIQFHQRSIAEQEKLDLSHLAEKKKTDTQRKDDL